MSSIAAASVYPPSQPASRCWRPRRFIRRRTSSFSGAERWAHVFDDPRRDAWQKPHEVIEALSLAPDVVVADIGAGTGYFSVRLANMLPRGRVYAVDIEPDMVRYLAERAKREKRDNMVAVAGQPGDPKLPARVDLVLMVDVYHHVDDRIDYFRRLRGALKPGGRVAIIDFRRMPEGPPQAARISLTLVEMKRAGSRCARTSLPTRQYFLVRASPMTRWARIGLAVRRAAGQRLREREKMRRHHPGPDIGMTQEQA